MKIIYQVGEFIAKHAVAISAVAASLMLYNGVLTLTIIKTKLYNAYLRVAIALDTAYRATMTLTRSAMVALHAVWALLTRGVQGYIVVMRAARLASLTNPWTALATVLSVVGVAIYSATKAWQAHKQAIHDNLQEVKEANAIKKQQAEIDKRVAESHIEEKTRIAQLNKIIHSNAFPLMNAGLPSLLCRESCLRIMQQSRTRVSFTRRMLMLLMTTSKSLIRLLWRRLSTSSKLI